MICAVKFLARVAFAKFVHFLQMFQSFFPILLSWLPWSPNTATALEFFSAIAACVGFSRPIGTLVECAVVAREKQRRARPTMPSHMKTILVALCFILVLESIATKRTFVLLLGLMRAKIVLVIRKGIADNNSTYLSSSAVSNFFGFLGQHSHMKKPPGIFEMPVLDTSLTLRGEASRRVSLLRLR